jgi:hypothetical protein
MTGQHDGSVGDLAYLLEEEPISEPAPTLSSPPVSLTPSVERVPIASEHLGLTPQERVRIGLIEEALLQLVSPVRAYKRDELFPKDPDGKRWQLEYLRKLASVNVLVKEGERFFAQYVGVQERVEELLNKPEWLLKLFAPSALVRVHEVPSPGIEHDPEEMVVEPGHADVRLEDLHNLLPQYFDLLASYRDRIISLESQLEGTNTKLDALMAHFGLSTPVLAAEDENADKDEDGSDG